MFGWRKKQDGFEWHDYVRTTILVRRAKRREKVDDARQAAVDGLKDAGAAAAQGLPLQRLTGAADELVQTDVVVADAAFLANLPSDAAEALARAVRSGRGLVVEAGGSDEAWARLATSPLAALLDIRRNRALVEGSAKDADDLALREILIEKFI